MRAQSGKISDYADCSSLLANTGETQVSAVLYHHLSAKIYGATPANADAISQVRVQLEGKIVVQCKAVKYLDSRSPSDYLGLRLAMALDWRFQHQLMTAKNK